MLSLLQRLLLKSGYKVLTWGHWMKTKFVWGIILSVLFTSQAWAFVPYSLVKKLIAEYYYDYENQRLGMEIEYRNLNLEKSAAIAVATVGGTAVFGKNDEGLAFVEIQKSYIGTFKIKVETNQKGDDITPESEWVYEIVGPPLYEIGNDLLDLLVHRLHEAGATGAEDGSALSIQTNREVAPNAKLLPRHKLLALLKFEFKVFRNIINNIEKLMSEWNPVSSRLDYIALPSKGFRARMRDPNYDPSAEQILEDVIYRQSLEFLMEEGEYREQLKFLKPDAAWTLPFPAIMSALETLNFPVVPKVVKLTPFRMSSLICFLFPTSPYCRVYIETGWTFLEPIVENRVHNNNHKTRDPRRETVGMRNATLVHGLFIFDDHSGEFSKLSEPVAPSSAVCLMLFPEAG